MGQNVGQKSLTNQVFCKTFIHHRGSASNFGWQNLPRLNKEKTLSRHPAFFFTNSLPLDTIKERSDFFKGA